MSETNEDLSRRIYEIEKNFALMQKDQEKQAEDTKEIKELLKEFRKSKEDDVKWIKRQFISLGIGVVMTILALGYGSYSMMQVNKASEIIKNYERGMMNEEKQ